MTFFRVAVVFELSLAVLAFLIGWPVGIDPWSAFEPNLRGLVIGTIATGPLVLLLLICDRDTFAPMRRIRELLEQFILPSLRGRPIWQLAVMAASAGIGEETLFRGLLQDGLRNAIGPEPALVITSFVFGLLHALTPTYAILATGISLYLGVIYDQAGNLMVPVVAHGLYDLIALIYFLQTSRDDTIGQSESSPEEPPA